MAQGDVSSDPYVKGYEAGLQRALVVVRENTDQEEAIVSLQEEIATSYMARTGRRPRIRYR